MYVFTQFFRLGSICGMAFKLKTYQLLPQKCVTLWDDILDIIGPVKKWPPKMRNLFFKQGLSHFERLKVCAFVYVNGLNPVMFFEWVDFLQLLSNEAAHRECQNWFNEFKNNTMKWKHIYQFNVYYHRYEYIDGRVKYHLPLQMLHPW